MITNLRMRKNKNIILAITVLITFVGCRKDISLQDPSLEKLFGKWDWVNSSGGIAGGTRTPASEGYTFIIEFSKKGIYKTFKNGEVFWVKQGKFSLEKGTSIYHTGEANLINYKDEDRKQEIKFAGDTLYLDDQCYDCYSNVYVKK